MTHIYTKLGLGRLRALHTHASQTDPNLFDFGQYVCETDCGSLHCLLGMCPTIFPKDWYWNGTGPSLFNSDPNCETEWDAQIFFKLTNTDVNLLFYPIQYAEYGARHGCKLDIKSDLKTVLDNLLSFIKDKEKTR